MSRRISVMSCQAVGGAKVQAGKTDGEMRALGVQTVLRKGVG